MSGRFGTTVAIPEFGGLFLDGGVLRIWLAGNVSESAAIRTRSELANHVSDDFRDMPVTALAANYSYEDLAKWCAQLSDIRDAVPSLVTLGVSHRHNRVEIGVTDLRASREALETELPRRGIPTDAVRLIEQPPIGQLPSGKTASLWWVVAVGVVAAGLAVVAAVAIVKMASNWTPPGPALPAGATAERWRWEAYGGIELQVPPAWGYGVAGTPWCANRDHTPVGTVGRPGPMPLVMCGSPHPPVEQRAPRVDFDGPYDIGTHDLDGGWRVETRKIGSVLVTVFAQDAELRKRIFDSARIVTATDHFGCPTKHPASSGRSYRPAPDGSLPIADDVESLSVCRYERGDTATIPDPIRSASQLTGTEAANVVNTLHAAPVGHGPNDPDDCLQRHALGEEVMVLLLHQSSRTHDVVVRYAGCDGHGIDDGHTQRKLTPDVLRSLLVGPHEPAALHTSIKTLTNG